jgi:hypothetical protein
MGKRRIIVFGLVVLVSGALPGLCDPLRTFAICTGRLSALMEHQWLMQDPAADQTQKQRDAFTDLLSSVQAPGQARRSLALRIEAKAATAQALQRAEFAGHPVLRLRVMAQVKSCLRLLPQA